MSRQPSDFGSRARFSLVLGLGLAYAVLSVSCSKRSTDTTDTTTQTDDGTGGTSDTNDTYTNPKTPSNSQLSTFPTSGTSIPGSLFNTSSSTTNAQSTVNNLGTASSSVANCIQNGFAVGSTGKAGTVSPSCLNGQALTLSPDGVFNLGLGAYARMDDCLSVALSYQPQTQDQAPNAFYSGASFLINCYRGHVLDYVRQGMPWSGDQQGIYQSQDNTMQTLLLLLLSQKGKEG